MNHNKKLTSRAQELRRNMTKEERKLWYEYLNRNPFRFRRQVTVGRFILDFYCASAQLAVELDGSQHYEESGHIYDTERDAYLDGIGVLVLRFSNTDVLKNFSGVCQLIDQTVRRRTSEKAFPFGEGGRA